MFALESFLGESAIFCFGLEKRRGFRIVSALSLPSLGRAATGGFTAEDEKEFPNASGTLRPECTRPADLSFTHK